MRSTCLSVINKRKWYYIKYINTAYRLTGYITILISTLFLNCSITPLYYVMPAEFGMCWSHSRNLSSRGCGWLLSTTTVLVYCCSLVVVFFSHFQLFLILSSRISLSFIILWLYDSSYKCSTCHINYVLFRTNRQAVCNTMDTHREIYRVVIMIVE